MTNLKFQMSNLKFQECRHQHQRKPRHGPEDERQHHWRRSVHRQEGWNQEHLPLAGHFTTVTPPPLAQISQALAV